jgi:hypothetical protein
MAMDPVPVDRRVVLVLTAHRSQSPRIRLWLQVPSRLLTANDAALWETGADVQSIASRTGRDEDRRLLAATT